MSKNKNIKIIKNNIEKIWLMKKIKNIERNINTCQKSKNKKVEIIKNTIWKI